MEPGDLVDLDITGIAHGGVFVARHEGRVVFVPDAIPGERVRVRLTDTGHPSFWRAEALEVRDASPHRRAHIWRQADIDVPPEDRPGGADFGHIDLAHQRQLKRDVLVDALQRLGGMDSPVTTMAPALPIPGDSEGAVAEEAPDGTGWRTRVSLHVDAAGRVGPFAARSHRVIAIDDLPLATAAIERAARNLTGDEPGRIDLVQPADGRVRVLPRPRVPRGRRRGTHRNPPDHRPDPAREVVVERVGDREFRLEAGGFWQVHRLAAHTLVQAVASRLDGMVDPDAEHLDLYGGVGLFAATLAGLGAARVTSVESDRRATEHARTNLAEWPGAHVETGRVDEWMQRLRAEASTGRRERLSRGVVLLDPPRSGAGRDVVESVIDLAPATVVYVACDPVALARDVKTFRAGGYETAQVDAFDLFPNSHHVEAVTVLNRDHAPR